MTATTIIVLGVIVSAILLLNDWWKRLLIRRAKARNKPIPTHLGPSKTTWPMVAFLVLTISILALIRYQREWIIKRDWGGFTPIVHHLAGPD